MAEREPFRKHWRRWRSLVILGLTPIILSPLPLVSQTQEAKTAYVILIMAVYWVSEIINLAVTSFLPLLLFPLLGIMKAKQVSMLYLKDINILLMGGLLVSIAIERWNVHKRIALKLLLMVGLKAGRLMLAFMLMTAFLSMWITNTATTAMMTPIMEAVLKQLDEEAEREGEDDVDGGDEEQGAGPSHPDVAVENGQENIRLLYKGETEINNPVEDPEPTIVKRKRMVITESKRERLRRQEKINKAMMMCICYSANIGGTGTLTGTTPQLIFAGVIDSNFKGGTSVSFLSWFIYACPQMLIFLFIAWVYLQLVFFGVKWRNIKNCFTRSKSSSKGDQKLREIMKKQYDELGPIKFAEMVILGHFAVLVLLWLTRDPKFVPGWGSGFKKGFISDGTAVMIVVFSLFIFPSQVPSVLRRNRDPGVKQEAILEWKYAQKKLQWNVILLIGSGFAIAGACQSSGLSAMIGCKLAALRSVPDVVIILVISTLVTFLTEFTSNTATANILMPTLASMAVSIKVHPYYLMVPAAVCCSFAFMFPIATPPNALVFATGRLKIRDMIFSGIGMNFIGIFVVVASISTYGKSYYDLDTFPAWAASMVGKNPCAAVVNAAAVATTTATNGTLMTPLNTIMTTLASVSTTGSTPLTTLTTGLMNTTVTTPITPILNGTVGNITFG